MSTTAAQRREALAHDAAAVVVTALPHLDAATATSAISDAAQTSAALERLIEHLRHHPDALKTGRPDAPTSVIKLAHRLHERGIEGVVPPGCAVCGRVVREPRRIEGKGGVCQGCYLDSRRRTCSRCGKVARIVSGKNGQAICNACHISDPARYEACAECGKPRRVVHRDDQGRPRCARCYPRPRRACSSCGAVATTAAFTEAGSVCPRCYSAVKPKRKCGRCGRTRSISRRATEHSPDLCYSCDSGPEDTCSRCGQLAPRQGYRGGQPICQRCYERPVRRCDFCGELRQITAHWPSGAICTACYPRIRASPENCPSCGQARTLSGLDDRGQLICADCAGYGTTYRCARCGGASDGYMRDRCIACALRERLDVLLANPDGDVHPSLRNVHETLTQWPNPRSVHAWLDRSAGVHVLEQLARTSGQITHADLDAHPRSKFSHHLRQALVHGGALPQRDEPLEQVEMWLDDFLRDQPPTHGQILRPLRRLGGAAPSAPTRTAQTDDRGRGVMGSTADPCRRRPADPSRQS